MLVFIDDSGDPGFKVEKGSTRFFVISLVIFDDDLEAERVAVAIKELRRSLGFPDDFEFKFNKSSKSVRAKFLKTVAPFSFKIRSIVMEKSRIRSEELRSDKNSFYGYAIKMVLKHTNDSILDARIKIDGSGDRAFKKNFLGYLQRELNSNERRIMRKCKLVDSKGNVLIQLADMIVGSVRRSYDTERSDHKIYKHIVRRHIEDEWLFQ